MSHLAAVIALTQRIAALDAQGECTMDEPLLSMAIELADEAVWLVEALQELEKFRKEAHIKASHKIYPLRAHRDAIAKTAVFDAGIDMTALDEIKPK